MPTLSTRQKEAFDNFVEFEKWMLYVISELLISGTSVTITGNVNALGLGDAIGYNFVRPNDVTAYTAKDIVSDTTGRGQELTLTLAANKTAYITGVTMATDQPANTARFRIHFFMASFTQADNSAFDLTVAKISTSKYLGNIDLPPMQIEGAGSALAYSFNFISRLMVKANDSGKVYAYIETLDAFTPNALQNFYLRFNVDYNN